MLLLQTQVHSLPPLLSVYTRPSTKDSILSSRPGTGPCCQPQPHPQPQRRPLSSFTPTEEHANTFEEAPEEDNKETVVSDDTPPTSQGTPIHLDPQDVIDPYPFPNNASYSTLVEIATLLAATSPQLNSEHSSPGVSPSEYYTRSSQLTPQVVPYDCLSPVSKLAFGRLNIIEEIVDTEESYISSLKMLSGIYLDSLINKGNNGIPVRATNAYVEMLIQTHEDFLSDLRNLITLSSRIHMLHAWSNDEDEEQEYDDETDYLILSTSSPVMAMLVAELVSRKAIPVYLYQEYSSIHDLVLKLMESKADDPEMGNTLTRSYQRFLESTQKNNERMDLSFRSLVSKPVARIAKYKLFLDALSRLTPLDQHPSCHERIVNCILKVDYSIREVNRYGLQEKLKTGLLFPGLVFNADETKLKFPVEYLGLPLLSGALYTSWVESKLQDVNVQPFGIFLFKTHLILAQIAKSNKFLVKFLIPLSVCKVVDSDDINGGISCNYDKSFKLIFENNYQLFEVLLTASDENEYTIWREKLEILTNIVNGPYKFDYSSSKFNEEQGTSSSTIMPCTIQPMDVKLDKISNVAVSNSRRHHGHGSRRGFDPIYELCYFRQIIPVKVQLYEELIGSFGSVRFRLYMMEREEGVRVISLRTMERTKVETMLEDLWSDELSSVEMIERLKSGKPKRKKSRILSTTTRSLQHSVMSPTTDVSIDGNLDNGVSIPNKEPTRGHSRFSKTKGSLIRHSSVFGGLRSLFGSMSSTPPPPEPESPPHSVVTITTDGSEWEESTTDEESDY